jgi:chemotaxis protein methyltransferase CheR
MNAAPSHLEIESFREIIATRLGLQFDDGKSIFLSDILRQRASANGRANAVYLGALGSECRQELQALAALLTVPETYCFRNPDHFRALAELVLPERLRARAATRKLRLLSAGCASGEEAYSLAIVLRDRFPETGRWEVHIQGVDINPVVIQKAERARYTAWSLRETSAETRHRYFRKEGNEYVLDRTIRAMASFDEGNLADESLPLWSAEKFDVILCRNVIMYLAPDRMEQVVGYLSKALAPGGYLFLGHAETLRGLSHDFHLRHTHDTFYYQKKEDDSARARPRPAMPPPPAWQEVPWSYESWVDAIRTASERIQDLARDCGKQPGSVDAAPAALPGRQRRSTADLGVASELLREEKFREALEVLRDLDAESAAGVDAQLLRAILLTECGDIPAAEAVCAELLAADDLNAGAHYVMALCREHSGDRGGAMEQDRLAVHLDPSFASPHLHLGLLAQRTGDAATGRHELQQAVALLLREDASRILLFGGGFSREALLEFSRAQLRACGGSS